MNECGRSTLPTPRFSFDEIRVDIDLGLRVELDPYLIVRHSRELPKPDDWLDSLLAARVLSEQSNQENVIPKPDKRRPIDPGSP